MPISARIAALAASLTFMPHAQALTITLNKSANLLASPQASAAFDYAATDVVGAINILSRGMQKLRDEGQDTADASAGCASTARIACEVNGAVRPSATGTRRSDSARLDA